MDYPVKTSSQLRPLLVGFRKAAGFTQADVAIRLGVTQQSYAQMEAKPESVSMDRLFTVLRLFGVEMTLGLSPDKNQNDGKALGHGPDAATRNGTPGKPREDW